MWLTIIFIEDKYVGQESTSQKLTFSMVVGVGPRRYLLTALSPDCTSSYANPTSWMIQGVVIDGKVVGGSRRYLLNGKEVCS